MDAVIADAHGKTAAADIDVAECVVVLVFRVESVGSGFDGECAVGNADGVVGFDCLGSGCDLVCAAGYFEVVLADNAVVGRVDGEGACAVEHDVVLGEDNAVGLCVAVSGECACDGEGIVPCQGDKHLVGVLHVDARSVGVGDGHAVENDLHLVLVARVNDDCRAFGAACDVIYARLGDGDIFARFQGELRCLAEVRRLGKIALGEEFVRRKSGSGRFGCCGNVCFLVVCQSRNHRRVG